MGENKALLTFENEDSLTKYQYKRLQKMFTKVYIATKQPELFKDIDASFIDESKYMQTFAPTAGFIASFKQLKEQDALFVLSVDTPFVNKAIIDACLSIDITAFDAIIVRTPHGIHPMCGVYSRNLEQPLEKMLQKDTHKLGKLLKDSHVFYVDIKDEDLLMNINTPLEYQDALHKLNQG